MEDADIKRLAGELYNRIYNREVLISCTEAARLLGKTRKTISQMIADGRLQKTTIGDSTGIRLSDINPA